MIGKQMKVPTSKMQLTKGDKIEGVMKIPPLKHGQHILEGTIEISNDKGEVIARPPFLKEKAIPGKEYEFDWDGTDANHMRIRDSAGNEIEDGNYKIVAKLKISGTDQGDDWIPIPTVIKTKVSSVSITDSGEIEFSATGIGTLTLPELREISDREISDRKATTEVEELAEAILSRTRLVQQPTAALEHAVALPQTAPLVDVRS
jgi:flagellar hook assembly protein FlgD